MSHHSRVRADLAAWSDPTMPLAPEEIEQFDAQLFASINGDEGGVWAPTSQIEIGGDGLEVSGPFVASGGATFDDIEILDDLDVGGDVVIDGSLTVTGLATLGGDIGVDDLSVFGEADFAGHAEFNGTASFENDATFNDLATFNQPAVFENDATFNDLVTMTDDLAVTGDIECDDLLVRGTLTVGNDPADELIVNGITTFNGDVLIEDDFQVGTSEADTMTVEAVAQFNGNVTIADDCVLGTLESHTITIGGTPTLAAPMQYSANGRVGFRTLVVGDASTTINTAQVQVVMGQTALTANRTYSLNETGAQDGDFLWFAVRAPTASSDRLTVERANGSQLFQLVGDGGGDHFFLCLRVGGVFNMVLHGED